MRAFGPEVPPPLPDAPANQQNQPHQSVAHSIPEVSRRGSSTLLRDLWEVLARRRRLAGSVVGGLLLLCLVYCLVAPNQYEASARVELRAAPASSLNLGPAENSVPASFLSAPVALETMADVFRSDRLAWRVIRELKLYDAPGFRGDFAGRFPGFRGETPSGPAVDPAAQAWLLGVCRR